MSRGVPNPRRPRNAWEVTKERANGEREVVAYLPGSFSTEQVEAALIGMHQVIAMGVDADRFDVVWKWRHPEIPTPRPQWSPGRRQADLYMVNSQELVARRVKARMIHGVVESQRIAPRPGSPLARYLAGDFDH